MTIENNENINAETLLTETTPVSAPKQRKPRKSTKKVEPVSRIVTATLQQRQVRVVFKAGGKTVFTSRVYKTRNILDKIIAFARGQAKGAAAGAKAIAQVTTDGKKFQPVTE